MIGIGNKNRCELVVHGSGFSRARFMQFFCWLVADCRCINTFCQFNEFSLKSTFFLLRFSRRFAVFISVLLLFLGNSARRLCEKFMFRGFYSFCIPICFLFLILTPSSPANSGERERRKKSLVFFSNFYYLRIFYLFAFFIVSPGFLSIRRKL